MGAAVLNGRGIAEYASSKDYIAIFMQSGERLTDIVLAFEAPG